LIDEKIMVKLYFLGMNCQHLVENLLNDKVDSCTIAYRIIKKEKIAHILHKFDNKRSPFSTIPQYQWKDASLKSESSPKKRVLKFLI
jgi:hypothetical protein